MLRFALSSDPDATKRMWRDLAKVAGTGKVGAFGSRYDMLAKDVVPTRVMAADDREGNPRCARVTILVTDASAGE